MDILPDKNIFKNNWTSRRYFGWESGLMAQIRKCIVSTICKVTKYKSKLSMFTVCLYVPFLYDIY